MLSTSQMWIRYSLVVRSRSTAIRFAAAAATGGVLASYYLGQHPFTSNARGIANDTKKGGANGRLNAEPLSPVQVSSMLRDHEESYFVERGKGVVRYDVSQLASNSPIEDTRSEKVVQIPFAVDEQDLQYSDWMFWGVFDGHSGWTTSSLLKDVLIDKVLEELDKTYVKASPNSIARLLPSDPKAVNDALVRGFENLDDIIVNKSIDRLLNGNVTKAQVSQILAPALSGSCALLAFYDSYSSDLRLAVTGDSRAVLGSRHGNQKDGHWTATALTTDQTGSNQDEANRIRSEHPGEESTAVFRGRVLGSLEPTRSFGDARYKWPRAIQDKISTLFFGRRTPNELRSPPYVTASPVVSTTKVHPGDFVVLASDGLYEMLSNDEVVSLVAQWIEEKHPELDFNAPSRSDSSKRSFFGWGKSSSARREVAVEDVSANKDSQKQPIRKQIMGQLKPTVQDENVGTHLIRNALGGADQQQVSMLVSIPSPMSRSYRDDLTVTVIFFGSKEHPNGNGTLKINAAGTTKHRAKL